MKNKFSVRESDTLTTTKRISDSEVSIVISKPLYDALWKFVTILPKCDFCDKISTRKSVQKENSVYGYSCDEHEYENLYPNWKSYDAPWSESIRLLYKALEIAGYKTVEEAIKIEFSIGENNDKRSPKM